MVEARRHGSSLTTVVAHRVRARHRGEQSTAARTVRAAQRARGVDPARRRVFQHCSRRYSGFLHSCHPRRSPPDAAHIVLSGPIDRASSRCDHRHALARPAATRVWRVTVASFQLASWLPLRGWDISPAPVPCTDRAAVCWAERRRDMCFHGTPQTLCFVHHCPRFRQPLRAVLQSDENMLARALGNTLFRMRHTRSPMAGHFF